MTRSHLLPALPGLFLIFTLACGKKPTTNTNPNPITCNLGASTLVVNDTVYTIVQDTAYATLNNTFYTEHRISGTHGCSAEFEGGSYPVQGDYTITQVFTDVIPGSKKVYVLYYLNGVSYIAQSGVLKVSGTGASAISDLCRIKFKESFGDEKTISLKSDMQ